LSGLLRVGGHQQGSLARFDNLTLSKLITKVKLSKKEDEQLSSTAKDHEIILNYFCQDGSAKIQFWEKFH
jgi:predicted DNA-binding ribbon-helix-helix protein